MPSQGMIPGPDHDYRGAGWFYAVFVAVVVILAVLAAHGVIHP